MYKLLKTCELLHLLMLTNTTGGFLKSGVDECSSNPDQTHSHGIFQCS